MRRLVRILWYGAAVISLLLCVASGVLWVRGYWVVDEGVWAPAAGSEQGFGFRSGLGVVSLTRVVMNQPLGVDHLRYVAWYVTPGQSASYLMWMEQETWHGFEGPERKPIIAPPNISGYTRSVSAPFWFLFLCTALLPAMMLYRRLRKIRRPPGRCAQCGYDLRATPDRCPECGTIPVTAAPAAPPGGP